MSSVSNRDEAGYFREYNKTLGRNYTETQYKGYRAHFELRKKEIALACEGLRGTALILGAGNCNDIPLAALARQFDRVVLVDFELSAIEAARGLLDPELQNKVALQQADLSGVFDRVDAKITELKKNALAANEIASAFFSWLNDQPMAKLDYRGAPPSFICSSLVGNQIGGGMGQYLQRKRGIEISELEKPEIEWIGKAQLHHLGEIHRLLSPEGRVFFADQFSEKRVIREVDSNQIINEKPVINYPWKDRVLQKMGDLFSIIAKRESIWPILVGQETHEAHDENGTLIHRMKIARLRELDIPLFTLRKADGRQQASEVDHGDV